MADLSKQVAILIPSCDKYSDLWGPFFKCFHRFWPDCPFEVYLLANRLNYLDEKVRVLNIGDDVSWSDNVLNAVNQLSYEYIFLFIDDLFIVKPVETDKVIHVLEWAITSQVNYVRLNPSPRPDQRYNDRVGVVSPGALYRTSTVISIWKKQTLLALLRSNESAWDFEIKGSVRSDEYDAFYATWEDCLPVVNGVIKGKWRPKEVRKLQSVGVNIDLTHRCIMHPTEAYVFSLKCLRSKLLAMLPVQYRRAIRASFTRQPS